MLPVVDVLPDPLERGVNGAAVGADVCELVGRQRVPLSVLLAARPESIGRASRIPARPHFSSSC